MLFSEMEIEGNWVWGAVRKYEGGNCGCDGLHKRRIYFQLKKIIVGPKVDKSFKVPKTH